MDRGTLNKIKVECELLTDFRQTVEDSIGKSDTELSDGRVLSTDRLWTYCRKQQGQSDTEPKHGIL